MLKWASAFIGYFKFGFPGALSGYFIGSIIEQFFGRGSKRYFQTRVETPQPADFQINLLSLAATVIKADGLVKSEELQFVRNFFITNYGSQNASSIFETFNAQIKKEAQNILNLSQVFVSQTQYETRLQVLHFLFGVANADGSISQLELNKIDQIAAALRIRFSDFESIKAMFVKSSNNAYKILEITISATDADVKKAYRSMAKKYHPDKLQTKDPAMVKGAKEKFQEVQKAYEIIQKEREH